MLARSCFLDVTVWVATLIRNDLKLFLNTIILNLVVDKINNNEAIYFKIYKLANRNKVHLKMIFISKNSFSFYKNILYLLTSSNNIFIFIEDILSYYVYFFF